MPNQYTEQDLQKLVEAVEREFTTHLAKAEESLKVEPLVKAEEEKKEEEKHEDKPKDESHKDESKEAAPAESHEAPAKEAEHKPEGEKPEGHEHAEGDDHCDYDDEDREHMHKMYMSMSKGELKAHHDSCRSALDHKGMAKCGDMSMSKSENTSSVEVQPEVKAEPSPELTLLKSEFEAEKAKSQELQKSLDALSSFLTKLVEKKVAPTGKAITSMDVIAKSEDVREEKQLTKSEIDKVLNQKAQDPKLEKSDRDAINAYYLNSGSLTSISHLLK